MFPHGVVSSKRDLQILNLALRRNRQGVHFEGNAPLFSFPGQDKRISLFLSKFWAVFMHPLADFAQI